MVSVRFPLVYNQAEVEQLDQRQLERLLGDMLKEIETLKARISVLESTAMQG
jgi:hypothetical protein